MNSLIFSAPVLQAKFSPRDVEREWQTRRIIDCCQSEPGKSYRLIDGRHWVIRPYRDAYEGDCFYIAEARKGGGAHDHIGLSGNWESWSTTLKLFYSREGADRFAREVAGRITR